jgi:thiol-disulfide isomerase/thioredoxin
MAAILLIATAAYGGGSRSSDEPSGQAEAMMSRPEDPPEGGMMMSNTVPEEAMMSSGGKVFFTSLDDARMLAAAGPTVLFFHADWCPICRADMQEIDSRSNELGNITVVVVDYDRQAELKKMYGITYQHTYVQIDGEGRKIAMWNGGGVDGILENAVRGGM